MPSQDELGSVWSEEASWSLQGAPSDLVEVHGACEEVMIQAQDGVCHRVHIDAAQRAVPQAGLIILND